LLGIVFISVLFFASLPVMLGFVSLVMLIAASEWGGFLQRGEPMRYVYTLLTGAAMALIWLVTGFEASFEPAAIVAAVWWMLALLALLFFSGRITFLPAAIAGFCVLLPAWLGGMRLLLSGDAGSWLFLLAFVIVAAADIGAYFTGKSLGKHKLLPRVSPGKTVEGFAGGMVCATLASLAGAQLLDWPVLPAVIIGLSTGMISVVGDLTVSLLKRNAGLKDSGKILPGHGGVLDRIDGVTAALPLYTALLAQFGLLPAALIL